MYPFYDLFMIFMIEIGSIMMTTLLLDSIYII